MSTERRCYVCKLSDGTVHKRVFLVPGESDSPPPSCAKHGPMKREPNTPYRGTRA